MLRTSIPHSVRERELFDG